MSYGNWACCNLEGAEKYLMFSQVLGNWGRVILFAKEHPTVEMRVSPLWLRCALLVESPAHE